MNKDKEIEIQVQIENSEILVSFLRDNANFVGEKHQVDKYFSPPHRSFIGVRPVKEWLRLRNSSGKFSINYKNWYFNTNGKSLFCDEYETPVENLDQLEKIFNALNINKVITVDKTRKLYTYNDYEIAIDSVKGLGDFVEIEYKAELRDKKPADITKEMIIFLKKFNCGKISRNYVGYPFQLLFPKEVVFEEQ